VIQRAHKILLDPTVKQRGYFACACGVARFSWNWALAEWKRQYEAGDRDENAALNLKQLGAASSEVTPVDSEALASGRNEVKLPRVKQELCRAHVCAQER